MPDWQQRYPLSAAPQLLNLPSLLLTCGELAEDDPSTSAAVFALLCARLCEPNPLALPARFQCSVAPPVPFNASVVHAAQLAALLLAPLAPLPAGAASGAAAGRSRPVSTFLADQRRCLRLDPLGVGGAAPAALAALASRLVFAPLQAQAVSPAALASVALPVCRGLVLLGGAIPAAAAGGSAATTAAAAVLSSGGPAPSPAGATTGSGSGDLTLPLTLGSLCIAVDALLQVRLPLSLAAAITPLWPPPPTASS